MAVQLFSHNMRAYHEMKAMLEKTAKAAIIHPTGTGKSFIAFKWVEDCPNKHFVWLSPSDYICKTQVENVIRSVPEYPVGQITFMTYARLMMMADEEIARLCPGAIILDEFHRCGAKCWGEGVARLLKIYPHAQLLGLSATKIRYLDGQRDMAEELFEGCVASEMTLGEAIVRGILPTPTYVTTVFQIEHEFAYLKKRIDAVSSVALRRENQRYMDILRQTVENADGLAVIFARYMKERHGKYLVFCASRAHMRRIQSHVQEWFGEIDPQMHCYLAYSADPETSRAFKAFVKDESEHLKLLFSINMLNEGVHVQGVSGVILFRPTVSPIVYKQQIGRALTTGTQSTPLIVDVVNNFDGLSSYGTIQAEMDAAAAHLRREKRDREICTENLTVIEQAKDAVELFRRLEASLSSTWDYYFNAAYAYYRTHGDLRVPRRYVDENGLCLGAWIHSQRYARSKGQKLTQGQIERLNSIGMIWEDKTSLAWQEGFRHARQFYEEHGHLDVEIAFTCSDGYALGTWIRRMRQQKNGSMANTVLTDERIAELESIGMTWSVYDHGWGRGFQEARCFYEAHGHLDVPGSFVSETGFALGHWISTQRQAKTGQYGRRALTQEQMADLEAIGMLWDTRKDRMWQMNYEAAKNYYEKYGHIQMPPEYVTDDGIKLGAWIRRQRQNWKNGKHTDQRLYEKLSEIGMFANKSSAD